MRIGLMVFLNLFAIPVYLIKIKWLSRHRTKEETFAYIKKIVIRVNKNGRVKIEPHGIGNIPKEDGFVLFPNHQGLYDVLVFLETCPKAFSFVAKHEVKDVPLLKTVIKALDSLTMDRSDLRQSMRVIQQMSKRVADKENFLIFAEGTRSRMGNKMLPMKAGSFKCAVKAKAPIVPCALIDSFVPFDEKSIRKITVKVFYLKPMYYDEYKDMTTVQIAEEVGKRIQEVLDEKANNI